MWNLPIFLRTLNKWEVHKVYHCPPGVSGGSSWSQSPLMHSLVGRSHWHPVVVRSPQPSSCRGGERREHTNQILAGVIYHFGIDDKVGPIIWASQRCVPKQTHWDINRQYSKWIKELIKLVPRGCGTEEWGHRLPLVGDHRGECVYVCVCDKINLCLLNKGPAWAVFCYSMRQHGKPFLRLL